MAPLRGPFHFEGLLYFAWVAPGALAVALYLRIILAMPRQLPRNIVIPAAIHVGGSLGLSRQTAPIGNPAT